MHRPAVSGSERVASECIDEEHDEALTSIAEFDVCMCVSANRFHQRLSFSRNELSAYSWDVEVVDGYRIKEKVCPVLYTCNNHSHRNDIDRLS